METIRFFYLDSLYKESPESVTALLDVVAKEDSKVQMLLNDSHVLPTMRMLQAELDTDAEVTSVKDSLDLRRVGHRRSELPDLRVVPGGASICAVLRCVRYVLPGLQQRHHSLREVHHHRQAVMPYID